MARKTFGRDGRGITVIDATVRSDASAPVFESVDGTLGSVTEEDGHIDGPDEQRSTDGDGTASEDNGPGNENRFVDPTTATAPKRRGRKPGSKYPRKNAPQAIAFATANLEKVLLNLHLMGSALLAEPELIIDTDEAKLLADAIAEVAKAYDFTAILSPKMQAGIDLTIALATVYGGRTLRIMARNKRPRATVVNIQQTQQPATN